MFSFPFAMGGLLIFLACLASSHAGYVEECYHCAYNPADINVDQIQVSSIVYDEIRVPRTVYHKVKVSRVAHDWIWVCIFILEFPQRRFHQNSEWLVNMFE